MHLFGKQSRVTRKEREKEREKELKEEWKEKKKEIFRCLAQTPRGHNTWSWSGLKPGARVSSQVSYASGRSPVLKLSSDFSQDAEVAS